MNCISTTNSVPTTSFAQERITTPDILGGSSDVFGDSSNDNTIDDEGFIAFDINRIP